MDRTEAYSAAEKLQLWRLIRHIGDFKIARIAVSADSKKDLLNERFHIIEINVFTPMPLNLLDRHDTWENRTAFIDLAMLALAQNVGSLSKNLVPKPIFFKKLKMHYRVKI